MTNDKGLARFGAGQPPRWRRRGLVFVTLACLAVATTAAILARRTSNRTADALAPPRTEASGPNVVLVTFCTLRADRIGCYGYDRADTPNFEVLAKGGVVFDAHYTQASFSGGSFASIMTGKYCFEHGVFDHPRRLADEHVTLAELLTAAGYQTAAYITHKFAAAKFNYNQGFGTYSRDRNARQQVEEAARWIAEHADRPFFLWYQAQPGHYPYRGPKHLIPPDAEPIDFTINQHNKVYGETARGRGRLMFDFPSLGYTAQQFASMMTLYDVTVAMADRMLGDLGQALKSAGVLDNTLIIATADHGEAHGEHGYYFNHAANLYEPAVRVPLIIRLPQKRLAGRRVAAVTRNIDLLPTIADVVGLEPPANLPGQSLIPMAEGPAPPRDAFAESGLFRDTRAGLPDYRLYVPGVDGKWRMIRRGDYKLICVPGERDDGQATYELYNLVSDPQETQNLADAEPAVRGELAAALEAWFSAYIGVSTAPADLDPEDLDELRSLGYID